MNTEAELKSVFSELQNLLEMIPIKQKQSFDIKAVNNGELSCHGMLNTECLQMDHLKLGIGVETIWMFQDKDVHFLIFQGIVNLHFRLNENIHKKHLDTKQSLRIPSGIPFMLKTYEQKASLLLISIPGVAT